MLFVRVFGIFIFGDLVGKNQVMWSGFLKVLRFCFFLCVKCRFQGVFLKIVVEKFFYENLLENSGLGQEIQEVFIMIVFKIKKVSRLFGVFEIFRGCQFYYGVWEIICIWYIGSKLNEKEIVIINF